MPSPADPVAVTVLGIEIRWYALFMLAGIVAGLSLTHWLAKKVGLNPNWALDVAPWVVLSSILGARIYYVALRADYFVLHPWEAVNIRQGGLSFHGALIAGTLTFAILCRRHGEPFFSWTDVAIPGVAIAQAVGRWGNWANQEAFGLPTSLPWGLWIDLDRRPVEFIDAERFHPTFLYESIFNLANAALLSYLALRIPRSSTLRHGDVLALYLVTYGVGRFLIERLRTDSLYIAWLPAAFWLSGILAASGLILFVVLRTSVVAPTGEESPGAD